MDLDQGKPDLRVALAKWRDLIRPDLPMLPAMIDLPESFLRPLGLKWRRVWIGRDESIFIQGFNPNSADETIHKRELLPSTNPTLSQY